MIATIIKVSVLLALLVPVVGWPIACGSLLFKAGNAETYQFPADAPRPSSNMVKELRAASRELKWNAGTSGVQDLQYRMTNKDHDLPVFVATLVQQHGGEAALERDWSNDFDTAPKYVVHARVPPALASDMMDVEGDDPASIQAWMDRKYAKAAASHAPPDATAALVPVRVEFIGPHVEMMSIQFDVKGLFKTWMLWMFGVLAILFLTAVFTRHLWDTPYREPDQNTGNALGGYAQP